MAWTIFSSRFYEQAKHIRGPQTNFNFSLLPLNCLLAILKTYWSLKNGLVFSPNREGNGNDDISSEEQFENSNHIRISYLPHVAIFIKIFEFYLVTQSPLKWVIGKVEQNYCGKREYRLIFWSSVADPDPGSGSFLTPGSGIRIRFFPDPASRIPDSKPIFLRA